MEFSINDPPLGTLSLTSAHSACLGTLWCLGTCHLALHCLSEGNPGGIPLIPTPRHTAPLPKSIPLQR